MNDIVEKISQGEHYFGSGCYNTPEFNRFFNEFRKKMKKELELLDGYSNSIFSKGHFYISGFFSIDSDHYYFSISDVRGGIGRSDEMLVRTATNYQDYTGGINRYVKIDNFVEDFKRTFNI